MGVAGELDAARQELNRGRAVEAARKRRALLTYLACGVLGSLTLVAIYVADGELPPLLWMVTAALAAGFAGAWIAAWRGARYWPGLLAQVMPIAPIVVVSSALSVEAGSGSLLLIGALGVMVTIPEGHNRTRFAVVAALVVATVLNQALFTRERAWAPLDAALTTQISTVNRAIMTIALFALALELTRSTRSSRRLVEATLRVADMLATTDPLTGLPNRRSVWDRLHRMREGHAIALADVDHFKAFNDAHGHDCGDEVLKHVATVLRSTVRDDDLVARWGGEEFVVVLATEGRDAAEVLERVRHALATTPAPCGSGDHTVTMSVGWADVGDDASAALRSADAALYRAKATGRNRVERGGGAGEASAGG